MQQDLNEFDSCDGCHMHHNSSEMSNEQIANTSTPAINGDGPDLVLPPCLIIKLILTDKGHRKEVH